MKKSVFTLVIMIIFAAGIWYWWQQAGEQAQGMTAPAARPPQAVTFLEIKPTRISFTHELPGRVSAHRHSQVRPQVDGIITERLFEEGSDVKKGQQLYQIDDARYKAALNSARADLASARANVKAAKARARRYKELLGSNAISKQDYDDVKAQSDQAEASIAVAQAAVDVAQVNFGYTKVYAPISGRISRSLVTEGALVTANQAQHLTTIIQLDPVYIDMQQPGSEAIHLRSRMIGKDVIPVHVTLREATGKTFTHEGVLKYSEVSVDETTGSIALRALMPNPEGKLLPGLFVRATLDLGEGEVLLVPQRAAVRTPDGGLKVWVVDDASHAQARAIEASIAYEDQWVVSDGLQAGDRIIIEGYQKVTAGATVTAVPWKQGGNPEAGSQKSTGDKE